jgi:hypothetical protein
MDMISNLTANLSSYESIIMAEVDMLTSKFEMLKNLLVLPNISLPELPVLPNISLPALPVLPEVSLPEFSLPEFSVPEVTPQNVEIGIQVILALAGVFHMIPGRTLKMQSEQMKMPQWLIFGAGLLMLGTAILYYLDEHFYGMLALSVCMGGATATGFLMPKLAQRPGSMIFSLLTLLSGMWSYGELDKPNLRALASVIGCYIFGIVGRVYAPAVGCALAKKLFAKKEEPAKTGAAKAEAKAASPKPASGPSTGSRQRVASPGAKKAN